MPCVLSGNDALALLQGQYYLESPTENKAVFAAAVPAVSTSSVAHTEPSRTVHHPAAVDVMLLDIRMPGRTGTDVVKACTAATGALPCPVVAMTGNVDKDSVEEYKYVLKKLS